MIDWNTPSEWWRMGYSSKILCEN